MEQNILKIVLNAMVIAQNNKLGENKKSFVLSVLKTEIPNYERYEPIIDMAIDFIKLLSKNKELLKMFKKKCYLCI